MRSKDLNDAIESLYEGFASYRGAKSMEGCDDCTSSQDSERLMAVPLRSLEPNDLARYAFKAISTWGSVEDFKHFLPRIFELAATRPDEIAQVSIEAIYGKLSLGDWHTWPEHEIEAVRRYFTAYWNFLLTSSDDFGHVDAMLCSIGRIETDIAPFLRRWDQFRILQPIEHLSEFVVDNVSSWQAKQKLSNPYWDERHEQQRQVIEWLAQPSLVALLEYGCDLEGASDRVMDGYNVLSNWQKYGWSAA